MLTSIGATQTLMRRQGDWWVTVIGDVPAVTLRAFANGLERKK
jgi:sigma-E factor negative regulatory protein RseB